VTGAADISLFAWFDALTAFRMHALLHCIVAQHLLCSQLLLANCMTLFASCQTTYNNMCYNTILNCEGSCTTCVTRAIMRSWACPWAQASWTSRRPISEWAGCALVMFVWSHVCACSKLLECVPHIHVKALFSMM
jgi:hypothetical protein